MDDRVLRFDAAHEKLAEALKSAPTAQLELLAAVDALYATMDEGLDVLDDAKVLEAQILARHAESILTRYFGM